LCNSPVMPEPKAGIRAVFMVSGKPDHRSVSVDDSLHSIVQGLIDNNKLEGRVEDYVLVFQAAEYRIVTERDIAEMHAKIIDLTPDTPRVTTARIRAEIEKVPSDSNKLVTALEQLRRMSVDATFAAEWVERAGVELLMRGISGGKFRISELGLVLAALHSLLEQKGVAEQAGPCLHQDFVQQMSDLIPKDTSNPEMALAVAGALGILACLLRETVSQAWPLVDSCVVFSDLLKLLRAQRGPGNRLPALILINAQLEAAPMERRAELVRLLQERPGKNYVVGLLESEQLEEDMQHQLYLLQHNLLSLLQLRLHTPIQPQDGAALQKIKDLRSTAFDLSGSPGVKNNTRYAQDHKKLGFSNVKDPSLDFITCPPGILALDCMDHFAKYHQEQFVKVVLENSCRQDNHECPFAVSSCELVSLLADILGVGRTATTGRCHEMFLVKERPFEEFYSHCVVMLNKTWRDMRATREDFTKVFDVVREQITTSLDPERIQDRPKTFDQFRTNVKSYGEISRRWQSEAKGRDSWERSAPVQELRDHLGPEIEDLIRQQRANFMVEGTRFQRFKKTGEAIKSQYRFVKLHNNHKTLYVGDWNSEKSVPSIEDLEPRLHISDIQTINTGTECDFVKDWKEKKSQFSDGKLAFSLMGENGTSLLGSIFSLGGLVPVSSFLS